MVLDKVITQGRYISTLWTTARKKSLICVVCQIIIVLLGMRKDNCQSVIGKILLTVLETMVKFQKLQKYLKGREAFNPLRCFRRNLLWKVSPNSQERNFDELLQLSRSLQFYLKAFSHECFLLILQNIFRVAILYSTWEQLFPIVNKLQNQILWFYISKIKRITDGYRIGAWRFR